MINEIEVQSNLLPASFDRAVVKMTDAQKELLTLLKSSSENKEMITKNVIIDFYIKNIKRSETYKVYGKKPHPNPLYSDTHWVYDLDNFATKYWKDDWRIPAQALTWFKQNLGACILKGKLLAIPVIEID